MKKMIRVPVGAEPKIRKYGYGSNDEYIDYGWVNETLHPTGDLKSIISDLHRLQKKYRDRYQKMSFDSVNDCGCPHQCSCSPSYVLYGERYETDIEYEFRLHKEAAQQAKKEDHERKEYERLKTQFGGQ